VRVVWSPQSQDDLATLIAYYRDLGSDFGFKTAEMAVGATHLLARQPKLGPVIEDTIFRKWRIARTNHILVYRLDGERLRVVRVVHGSQDWRRFL
jgi:toxin ParE1/3/4